MKMKKEKSFWKKKNARKLLVLNNVGFFFIRLFEASKRVYVEVIVSTVKYMLNIIENANEAIKSKRVKEREKEQNIKCKCSKTLVLYNIRQERNKRNEMNE